MKQLTGCLPRRVKSQVLSPSMGDDGDGNSPDNIFASLTASDIWTSPLTQFTPNLPCDPQERIHFPTEPVASQASDESSFISRFFAPSDSPPNGEESS